MAGEKIEEGSSWRHEKKGYETKNKVQKGNSDHMEGKFVHYETGQTLRLAVQRPLEILIARVKNALTYPV